MTGARVRTQHRRNRSCWQPITLELRRQQLAQLLGPLEIVGVHHLDAQARARRMIGGDDAYQLGKGAVE
jgi:hypothetical protein